MADVRGQLMGRMEGEKNCGGRNSALGYSQVTVSQRVSPWFLSSPDAIDLLDQSSGVFNMAPSDIFSGTAKCF